MLTKRGFMRPFTDITKAVALLFITGGLAILASLLLPGCGKDPVQKLTPDFAECSQSCSTVKLICQTAAQAYPQLST